MPLSPLVLPPSSGAAIWEACAFPPLWGWLCGSLMGQGLWRQRGPGGTSPAVFLEPFLPCNSPSPASRAPEGKFLLPQAESIIPSSVLPEGRLRPCFS